MGTMTSPHLRIASTPRCAPSPLSARWARSRHPPVGRMCLSAWTVAMRPIQYVPCPRIMAPNRRKPKTSQKGSPERKSGRSSGTAARPRAVGTQPEDVEGVLELGEAVLRRHLLRPGLDEAPADLHGGAAPAAHEVVVVLDALAAPVEGLAVVGAQHVDLTGLGQRLEGAVDGGEPDGVPGLAQGLVQLLRAAEVVGALEEGADRGALPCHPGSHASSRTSSTSSCTSGCGSVGGRRRPSSGRTSDTTPKTPIARTTIIAPGESGWT